MRTFFILVFILGMFGVSGAPAADDPQVEQVGIIECDEFLKKKFACFDWYDKKQGDWKDTFIPRGMYRGMAKRWKEAAKTNPADVKTKCQTELENMRQSPGMESCPHW